MPQADWEGVRVYFPWSQKRGFSEEQRLEISSRYKKNLIYFNDLATEASRSAMLFRPSMRHELVKACCLENAGLIYSLWEGYLRLKPQSQFLSWLSSNGISMKKIHTSGHASVGDLKKLAKSLNPKLLVPIHSFATESYPDHFDRVEFKNDGDWWTV